LLPSDGASRVGNLVKDFVNFVLLGGTDLDACGEAGMVLVGDGDLKKDKDYFGFPTRFKIGATKES
jgi:hypothetical protein